MDMPPQVEFDPMLLDDPSIPSSFDSFRVGGLKQHLWRYSAQLSPRNIVTRLEDPMWLEAWDAALAATAGSRVVFRGSELGVFALRSLHHGASHAVCLESFPLDARIAGGMAQKHFLTQWHAHHGAAIQAWSEEERRASFNEFASSIDVITTDQAASTDVQGDCFVFPGIDHTLLGTGIVREIRRHAERCKAGSQPAPTRILPAKARVFATGIQWTYPGAMFQLEPMNRLRWSLYPQALHLGPEFWTPLTDPVPAGEIDFENFSETNWEVALPITTQGILDAMVFWFELDLGTARISNAPGSELRCIKPAVQYTDPIEVRSGSTLIVDVRVEQSRLHFQTRPRASLPRTSGLPTWYAPMLGDRQRNTAYHDAIGRSLAESPAEVVLDIGAGCGLLSMLAAQAGAERVIGCETHPAILRAGNEIIARNGFAERIALVGKDCRHLKTPDDLPQRAQLAIFELFDCSLIGEGILHFLAYAREHLLTEDARYVPAGARIRAQVIEYRLDRILDVDANLLNPYRASPSFINVDAATLDYRALTEPFDAFAFDFANAGPSPDARELRLPAIAPGTAGAVLFWFELQLDETLSLSNDPAASQTLHWKQGLHFLPEVRVDAGMLLPLTAKHDGSGLAFQWQQDGLPREAFSKLPRLDPRHLAASSEIEQQTHNLMQHCQQHPDEYAKVAQIAQRFAIDPAAHGLDPTIAQRFASMFL